MANGGGLSIPTEFCFSVVLLAIQYYTTICANEKVMQNLCLQVINVAFSLCSNSHYKFDLLIKKLLIVLRKFI